MSVKRREAFGAKLGKLRSSIALEQHAWELIIMGLSVTAPGFMLLRGLNYVCVKQGLGTASAGAPEKAKVRKTRVQARMKEK